MWFFNLPLRVKLLSGFALVAVMTAIASGYALLQLKTQQASIQTLYEQDIQALSAVKQALVEFMYLQRAERSYIGAVTEKQREKPRGTLKRGKEGIVKYLDEAAPKFVSSSGQETIKTAKGIVAAYLKMSEQLVVLADSEPVGQANKAMNFAQAELRDQGDLVDKALTALSQRKLDGALERYQQSIADFEQSLLVLSLLSGLALITAMGLGLALAASIRNSVQALADTATRVRETHDFSHRAPCLVEDETAQTARAFNGLLDTLQQSLGQVNHVVTNVAKGGGLGLVPHQPDPPPTPRLTRLCPPPTTGTCVSHWKA